ncbi:MAG: hypothetical protein ACHP7N_01385 [Caulobacterales bacterium]
MKLAVLAFVVAAAANAAQASPTAPVKIGQTAAGYQADIQACDDLAKTWPGDSWTGLPPPIGGAEPINPLYRGASANSLGLTGAMIAAWAGSEENRAVRARFQRFCMKDRGYAIITLTDQEARMFAASRSAEERAAWLANLTADAASERIRAANAAEPTPLPPARNEPFAIGAIGIDPSSLSLSSGAVAKGTLVTGRASHRLTAKLTGDLSFFGGRFEAGSELMQFLSPAPWIDGLSPHMTLWCRMKTEPRFAGIPVRADAAWCFRASDHDYEVVAQPGWFPTSLADITYYKGVPAPISLEVESEDELGALDLALIVEKVSPVTVTIAAQVMQNGKSVIVWRGAEPFDASGRAVLPFWAKRLVLTRDGTAVSGAWETGDGRGWADQP